MTAFLWSILAIFSLQWAAWEDRRMTPGDALVVVGFAVLVTTLLTVVLRAGGCRRDGSRLRNATCSVLPLVVHVCLNELLDYPHAVLSLPVLGLPFLSTVLCLLPYVVLRWTTLRRRTPRRHGSYDAAEDMSAEWVGRLQWQVELLPFLPFVLFQGSSELVQAWYVSRIVLLHVTGVQVLLALVGMWLILEGLPRAVPRMWGLRPLTSGPLRDELCSVATECRFRFREIYVWPTGRTLANAAIMGLSPGGRIVILTDLLLERLDPSETVAVFAHEMGHARRHHLPYFVALGVLFVFALGTAFQVLDTVPVWAWLGGACDPAHGGVLGAEILAGVVVLGFAGTFYLLFGRFSRACETEADLHAMNVTGEAHSLGRALLRVVGPDRALQERKGWRHESPGARIRFLQRSMVDPSSTRRFETGLRRWKHLLATTATGCVLWTALLYMRSLPGELAVTGLALGAYDLVEAQLGYLNEGDAREVQELMVAGRSLLEEGARREEVSDHHRGRALECVEMGELAVARDHLTLVRLRDGGDPADDGLERSLWVALELLEGGFREPRRRWRERMTEEGLSLAPDTETAILKALDRVARGGPR